MVRKIWMMPMMLLVAGMVAIGCGETEDYSAVEGEYTTAEEAALAAHTEAMQGWEEWNNDLTTVTVADDWDEDHIAAHQAANAKMAEYKTKLDEGQANVDKWKADIAAAKEEGGEAYRTALTDATAWYNDYNTWLNDYKADWTRYQDTKNNWTEGSEPWWYTMYGTNTSAETNDPAAATGDDNAEANANANGDTDAGDFDDDVQDAVDGALDAASDVIGDSDED